MTKVLFVTSSAQGENSSSTKLGERLIARIPGAVVTRRDVGKNPPPSVDQASRDGFDGHFGSCKLRLLRCLLAGVGWGKFHPGRQADPRANRETVHFLCLGCRVEGCRCRRHFSGRLQPLDSLLPQGLDRSGNH